MPIIQLSREAQSLRQEVEECTRKLEEVRKISRSLQSDLFRYKQEGYALRKEADDLRGQLSSAILILCQERERTNNEMTESKRTNDELIKEVTRYQQEAHTSRKDAEECRKHLRQSNLLDIAEKERASEFMRAAFQELEENEKLTREVKRLREEEIALRRAKDEDQKISKDLVEQLTHEIAALKQKVFKMDYSQAIQAIQELREDGQTKEESSLRELDQTKGIIANQENKLRSLTSNLKVAYKDRSRFRQEAQGLRKEVDILSRELAIQVEEVERLTALEKKVEKPLQVEPTVQSMEERRMVYDRTFLLQQRNHPISMNTPESFSLLDWISDIEKLNGGRPVELQETEITPPVRIAQAEPRSIKREITLTSSKRHDRPVDQNAWKPSHVTKSQNKEEKCDPAQQTEKLIKEVRSILNKLTPTNLDRLVERIKGLAIDTEDRLVAVIQLFFEKAVAEPAFSPTFAKMCQALGTVEVPSSINGAVKTNFKTLVLSKCHSEFLKDSAELVEVENKKREIADNQDESRNSQLEDELNDISAKHRSQSLGNVRFIGELFKQGALAVKDMRQCIERLLAKPDNEEELERLCLLLTTIGEVLEPPGVGKTPNSANRQKVMDFYFASLKGSMDSKISSRVRFMIQDVIDLRKSQWKPRREISNPKTIDQIHKEVIQERENQDQLNRQPIITRNFRSGNYSGYARK